MPEQPVPNEAGGATAGNAEPAPAPDAPSGPAPGEETAPGQIITQAVEDPVEILVGMAERGEIDPWNINIIEVTDRFLSLLERRRELNLQVSGRTLFYAATLLRMKSEQLDVVEEADDEGDGGDLFGDEFGGGTGEEIDFGSRLGPIERLEHEIQRRLERKSMRKSPTTLFELITELKNIEKEDRRRRRMSEGRGVDLTDSLIDAEDVVSIAHEEGFQETAMTRLAEYLEGLELDQELTLAELCTRMEWGIPEVYIPLLFLALDGRCSLRQEEFFGDIWVQIRHPEPAEAGGGAAEEST
ncbi:MULTISPECIES: segregation/condensation protein A [unclassified Methanoregula]|uniref:segregation/condensation protein A n=1 Tax=unclassified Methanoregula TaxID=2649730 RepID=UPI0009C6C38F|nr:MULTISPECIES: ScpA family protein [unclassified Methanoregula]OPX63996.1 MAG: segregation and condensation protein A [Methanoregula sp. PtaB.Bin085]OPY33806.1 MAG: segregation and condensation protein A [Methanoregula sp. PtaU1.Bin006]